MDKKWMRWSALMVAVVVQLTVLGHLVWQHESTLRHGEVVKLRCAPVDPYDPFRGRYVALDLEGMREVKYDGLGPLNRGERLYFHLEETDDGFSKFGRATSEPPANGLYLQGRAKWGGIPGGTIPGVSWTLDRYFLNENWAPAAERAYVNRGRQDGGDEATAWVEVRVRGKRAIIEALWLGDERIEDVARRMVTQES